MTSVSRRLNIGSLLASVAALLAGATFASGQPPVYVTPPPYGPATRLGSTNFTTNGLTSAGFQNTGFQNVGFQNVGLQSLSVSGVRSPSTYGAPLALPGRPFSQNNRFINQVPAFGSQIATPSVSNYSPAPMQYGNGLNPSTSVFQGPTFAPDDTATISIGPGTALNSGVAGPPLSRGARYTMGLGFESPVGVTTNPRLSDELQRQFTSSTRFGTGNSIKVAVENNVVVLRGKVADEHERDLAEMLVRLSPGVYNVQNDLQIEGGVATADR